MLMLLRDPRCCTLFSIREDDRGTVAHWPCAGSVSRVQYTVCAWVCLRLRSVVGVSPEYGVSEYVLYVIHKKSTNLSARTSRLGPL